jgi:ubiquinone/menaquinone biosynthesis C-methylase UbiE
MSHLAEYPLVPPGDAFDAVADSYDDVFTRSVIGRAQRGIVWKVFAETFRAGDRILELNCGTGEDALFLARRGISVEACDGSAQMIEVARKRKVREGANLPIEFQHMPTEHVGGLDPALPFDGVVSNFSGLNCVENLGQVALDLSSLVRKGGNLVLCLSSRVCAWELIWFTLRGNFSKGTRRLRGRATGHMGGSSVRVLYPSVKQMKRAFSPWFDLLSVRAVGLLVAPSYLEPWAGGHAAFLARLASIDWALGGWPLLRGMGDHILLRFQKAQP